MISPEERPASQMAVQDDLSAIRKRSSNLTGLALGDLSRCPGYYWCLHQAVSYPAPASAAAAGNAKYSVASQSDDLNG